MSKRFSSKQNFFDGQRIMRRKQLWLSAALIAFGLVVQSGFVAPARADAADKAQNNKEQSKGFKQEVKEGAKKTWSGFKKGLKETGESFRDAGHAIKKDAKESADKAKKDFSH